MLVVQCVMLCYANSGSLEAHQSPDSEGTKWMGTTGRSRRDSWGEPGQGSGYTAGKSTPEPPERRVCHWKQYWGTLLRVAKSKPGIVPYTRTVISTYFLISLSSVSTFSTLSSKLTHSLDNNLRINYMLGTILYSSNIKMSKNKCLSA